nr:unnamed protein product [Spirometra erinaceieuropaei]
MKAPGSPSLDVQTVYRPPRNDPTADARLIEDPERLSIRSDVLIMGDFNAPLVDWSSAYASGPDHAFDRRLLDMTLKSLDRAVDGDNVVPAIYVDFKKAFDSVPHQRLLYKLSRIGIRGNLLRWIQSFLIGRSQIVHVGDRQSAEVAVESGVPQGSVHGPTLFIIYVNDCVSELNCDVTMFADDVKLWSVIRTELDEERLQADLPRLEKWSQDWLLWFIVTKCNVLRVGRTRSQSRWVYYLNGIPLQEVDAQKDLGVWVTASLKRSLHCSKVAKSAMSVLYLVKKAFSTFNKDIFVKVFRSFVWPQLEFAIQVRKPWTSTDLNILEKVQRRATKLLRVTGAQLDIRKFFFSNRVIEAWNALPTDVVMSTSVEAFKRKLDQCTTKRHNAA